LKHGAPRKWKYKREKIQEILEEETPPTRIFNLSNNISIISMMKRK
jgi:hypothetical protein